MPIQKLPKVACLTMQRNDPFYLGIWVDYYSRSVGHENLFVISHGRDSLSLENLQNQVFVPNEGLHEHFDAQRWRFLSIYSASLLEYYDAVIVSDVDEIICPNPNIYGDINDFVLRTRNAPVIAPLGLELVQMLDEEPLSQEETGILEQRSFVVPHGAYSKPTIIRKNVRIGAGGHNLQSEDVIDYRGDCFNFHLRFVDETFLRQRLSTRSHEYVSLKNKSSSYRRTRGRNRNIGQYWSADEADSETLLLFEDLRHKPRVDDFDFENYLNVKKRFPRSRKLGEAAHVIPDSFRSLF